jgi:hypothetical protein
MLPLKDRFDAKHMPEPNSGCWLWLGAVWETRHGLRAKFSTSLIAARVAYEFYVGPIPTGLFICHKCDNTLCVNPDHLFPGTHRDNMQDMIRKGRRRQPYSRRNRLDA